MRQCARTARERLARGAMPRQAADVGGGAARRRRRAARRLAVATAAAALLAAGAIAATRRRTAAKSAGGSAHSNRSPPRLLLDAQADGGGTNAEQLAALVQRRPYESGSGVHSTADEDEVIEVPQKRPNVPRLFASLLKDPLSPRRAPQSPWVLGEHASYCWQQQGEHPRLAQAPASGGVPDVAWQTRCVPRLFLLGVAKCGTTAVWSALAKHPHVITRPRLRTPTADTADAPRMAPKEPHYWTIGDKHESYWHAVGEDQPYRYDPAVHTHAAGGRGRTRSHIREAKGDGGARYSVMLGAEEYAASYTPALAEIARAPDKAHLLDASTDAFTYSVGGLPSKYACGGDGDPRRRGCSASALYATSSAAALRASIPGARLAVVLRDPVARAWSDYMFFNRSGASSDDEDAASTTGDARASPVANAEDSALAAPRRHHDPRDAFHAHCSEAVGALTRCLAAAEADSALADATDQAAGPSHSPDPAAALHIPAVASFQRCTDHAGGRDTRIAPPMLTQLRCPLHIGMYVYPLLSWQWAFNGTDALMVVSSSDLDARPQEAVARVARHFGLAEPPAIPRHEWERVAGNAMGAAGRAREPVSPRGGGAAQALKGAVARTRAAGRRVNAGKYAFPMHEETRALLAAFYEPYGRALALALGDERFAFRAGESQAS